MYRGSLFYMGKNGWNHPDIAVGPEGLIMRGVLRQQYVRPPALACTGTHKLQRGNLAEVWCFECRMGAAPRFGQVSHLASACPHCGEVATVWADAVGWSVTPDEWDWGKLA